MTYIAKQIAKALGGSTGKVLGVKPATLVKMTPGVHAPGAASGGTNPTSTPYPCKAMIEIATISDVPTGTLIQQDDRKIGILGASLPAGVMPGSGNKITMVDLDGVSKTFRFVAVISGDGVGAMYEFLARL